MCGLIVDILRTSYEHECSPSSYLSQMIVLAMLTKVNTSIMIIIMGRRLQR